MSAVATDFDVAAVAALPLDAALGACRDLLEDPEFPTVHAWKASEGKILGHFQVYFPEELAHAAGMLPVKVRGAPVELVARSATVTAPPSYQVTLPAPPKVLSSWPSLLPARVGEEGVAARSRARQSERRMGGLRKSGSPRLSTNRPQRGQQLGARLTEGQAGGAPRHRARAAAASAFSSTASERGARRIFRPSRRSRSKSPLTGSVAGRRVGRTEQSRVGGGRR